MTQPKPRVVGPPLPRWAAVVGSLLIAYHLGCVALNAVAAPSGFWPGRDEGGNATFTMEQPPHLAAIAHEKGAASYLRAIKQSHNYHFRTNRVGTPEAYLKIDLYDKAGEVVKSLRFPDPKASAAVQNRQAALVRWLTEDQPVQRSMTEKVGAPGVGVPKITIWDMHEDQRRSVLTQIDEKDLPNRPTFKPTPWSLVVVRSLARYLCRAYDADAAEIVRCHRNPVPPQILREKEPQVSELDEQSSYGRLPR